jgi:hypothetical protein
LAGPVAATVEARALHDSALRRIWSRLLDRRDWTSYVYVPLILPILVLVPYLAIKSHERSRQVNHLIESFSQGSRDLEQMSVLLDGRQEPWTGKPAEENRRFEEPDLKAFEILQDSRIYDLRCWRPLKPGENDTGSLAFCYQRLKVCRQPEPAGNGLFHVDLLATSSKTAVRFPPQQLEPKLLRNSVEGSTSAEKGYQWHVGYDFQRVPPGELVDLIVEYHSPGHYLQRGSNGTAMVFPIHAETAELTVWILMPDGKQYQSFRIVRYKPGMAENVEAVRLVTEYLAEDFTIIAFKLLSLKTGYNYEVSWTYQ